MNWILENLLTKLAMDISTYIEKLLIRFYRTYVKLNIALTKIFKDKRI